MAFSPTVHPIYRIPTLDDIKACAALEGVNAERAYVILHSKREEAIKRERQEPLRYGWEPFMWYVCDCLLGLPWIPDEEAEKVRLALGFSQKVRILLILGGNRSGKSEYAAKRTMLMLNYIREAKAWVFHTSQQMSVEYQQKLLWKYMPAELRGKPIMTGTTYVAYKFKTGFSENSFTLPNLSWCSFRNYGQGIDTIEGGELDWLWDDEIVPPDWLQTQTLRLATKGGAGVITYTPVSGYTGVVKEFMDGSQTVRSKPGWLLPMDNGPWEEEKAIRTDGRAEIIDQDPATIDKKHVADSNKRLFEMVPRIVRCPPDPRKAVVFFHPSDNPFGNPREVISIVRPHSKIYVRERFYGIGNKLVSAKFARFNRKVHTVEPDTIPKDGTNYLLIDPCGGRNWYMGWMRATPDGSHYLVQEWPGDYEIPGIGHPGPWAEPSGKTDQVDGKRGSAQKSFGFGLMSYKREIARIEGWQIRPAAATAPDSKPGILGLERMKMVVRKMHRNAPKQDEQSSDFIDVWNSTPPAGVSESEWVRSWDADGPARLKVSERYLDSRYGNARIFGDTEPTTLINELEEWGLFFQPTTAGDKASSINEGCELINDALYFDEEQQIGFFNKPKLFISRECKNAIFALETWTGADGKDGASKDPIDVIRYYFLLKCGYAGEGAGRTGGGGHY